MTIEESWQIIERVVSDEVPEVAQTLRGAASSDEINRLQTKLGAELPNDFVRLLRIHNGQADPSRLHGLFQLFSQPSHQNCAKPLENRTFLVFCNVVGWNERLFCTVTSTIVNKINGLAYSFDGMAVNYFDYTFPSNRPRTTFVKCEVVFWPERRFPTGFTGR